jgi:hypothetical protein
MCSLLATLAAVSSACSAGADGSGYHTTALAALEAMPLDSVCQVVGCEQVWLDPTVYRRARPPGRSGEPVAEFTWEADDLEGLRRRMPALELRSPRIAEFGEHTIGISLTIVEWEAEDAVTVVGVLSTPVQYGPGIGTRVEMFRRAEGWEVGAVSSQRL